jgi:hypothetical protein
VRPRIREEVAQFNADQAECLDREIDWTEIAELCVEAYRVVARKQLLQRLDDPRP